MSKLPVVEIFGPTVQGEGVDQGVASHFIRFGGCDFKCDWCDTPYAVIPSEVKENAVMMNVDEILESLISLNLSSTVISKPPWVILTGGNPVLLDLEKLIRRLQASGYLVAVETQGSKWKDWLKLADRVCLSPKPPSAMQKYNFRLVEEFIRNAEAVARNIEDPDWWFCKIPIFDEPDLAWAKAVRSKLEEDTKLYLSAGNDAGRTVGSPTRADPRSPDEVRLGLLRRSEILTRRVFQIQELCTPTTIIQSQYHVLLWGNEKGR